MNSVLRLEFQVIIKNGQALMGVNNQIKAVGTTAKQASAEIEKGFGDRLKAWGTNVINWGKNIQWTGRQIEFSITMPVKRAAKAIADMAIENERALTKLAKVYDTAGDLTEHLSAKLVEAGEQLRKDVGPMNALQKTAYDLGRAFRALSDEFGISLDKVSDIGGMWAATGLTGGNLAKATKLTMEAMTVGDFSSQEAAFKSLVQIMSAYHLTVDQTRAALALINTAENVTAAQFADITDALARSGGAARETGVDLRHLAAMVTSLTPATGSAVNAGNALKTMFSKLMKPTQEAVDVLADMGINFFDADFQALNLTQRLELVAAKSQGLTQAQKSVADATIFGNYQLSRGVTLLGDIANENGNYQKVLKATDDGVGDASKSMRGYNDEIAAVLKSTPAGLDQMRTRIKNVANGVLVDLVPSMFMALGIITKLALWFQNLDPGIKRVVILGIVFMAATGPLLRYIGAFSQMIGLVIKSIGFIATLIGRIGAQMVAQKTAAAAEIASNAAVEASYASLEAIQASVLAMQGNIALIAESVAGVAIESAATAAGAAGIAEAAAGAATVAATEAVAAEAAAGAPLILIVAVVAAIAAAIAVAAMLIYKYRHGIWTGMVWLKDKIVDIFGAVIGFIVKAFNALPQSIQNAFKRVVDVVVVVAKAVAKALSHLNPFARHSPSLVDQVIAGVDIIARKYASLSNIGMTFRRAVDDINAFKAASAGALHGAQDIKRGHEREAVATQAPQAMPALENLYASYDALKAAAADVKVELDAQQAVVNDLQKSYDDLGKSLDGANKELRRLEKASADIKKQLDAAQSELDRFAKAPLVGMHAMEEQIWANGQAQKALRLEMMKMEDAIGPLDQLQAKMANLQGDIELMSGMQKELRGAGAGSEITGALQDQIDGFQQQKEAIKASAQPMIDLQNQLDALQRSAERMDLEKALKFEPLQHQIENLSNTMVEMPFDQIIAGITTNKAAVADLTDQYNASQVTVAAQQVIVDTLTQAHDDLGAQLDVEKEKLADLQKVYDDFLNMIKDVDAATDDMVSSLKAAADEASLTQQTMDAAGAGDFAAGDLGVPTLDLPNDQDLSKLADEWQKRLEESMKDIKIPNPFDKIGDFFGGIKDKWMKFWEWFGAGVYDDWITLAGWIDAAWEFIKKILGKAWEWIKDKTTGAAKAVAGAVVGAWDWIKDKTVEAWDFIKALPGKALDWIVDQATKLPGRIIGAIGDLGHLVVDAIAGGIQFMVDWFKQQIGLLLEGVGATIALILTAFLLMPGQILGFIKDVGTFLWDNIKAGWNIFKDNIGGIVTGVIDFFIHLPGNIWDALGDIGRWLWDKVEAGWNAWKGFIGDTVTGVVDFFIHLPGRVWDGLGDIGRWIWEKVKTGFDDFKVGIRIVIDEIVGFFTGLPGRIRDMAGDMLAAATEIGGKIKDGLLSFIGGAVDLGRALGNAAINFVNDHVIDNVIGAVNKLVGGWNSIADKAFSPLPHIDGLNASNYHIPTLHKGGMVPGSLGSDVPALLQAGEYVIDLATVRALKQAGLFGSNGPQLSGTSASVTPLPNNGQGAKVLQFNGDLSFPNVRTGEDANEFIRNLEALAGA